MPYSPQLSAGLRLSMLGGTYNNGMSRYTGSDSSTYYPLVISDFLSNQIPSDYIYRDILEARLTESSPLLPDSPVQQWTPDQQSIYGKIWETAPGPPTPSITGSNSGVSSTPTDHAQVTNTSTSITSWWPDWMKKGVDIVKGDVSAFPMFYPSVIIIIIGLLLLALAGYSIIIPSGARGRIAEKAIFS